MAEAHAAHAVPKKGTPAPVVRFVGWGMLAILAGYIINNFLNVGYGMPNVSDIISGQGGTLSSVTVGVYFIGLLIAFLYVQRSKTTSLRYDAATIHKFNCYLIRALFFSVFFVGLADAGIALMRVENMLSLFMSDDAARQFGRAAFVAPYVHIPLVALGFIVALFSRTLGFTWLALLIVAAELLIVVTRFVFSYEQAFMGDLVRYWYAALFLFASAYTLFDEGHVRVDILYAGFTQKTKGFVNAVGSLMLGSVTCWAILLVGMSGRQSMINAPVVSFEISQSGSAGMFIKYQMAVFIGLFAITMIIQFISYFFEAIADFRDEPGRREVAPVSH